MSTIKRLKAARHCWCWDQEDCDSRPAGTNSLQNPISKIARAKWTGGVAHTVECLLCKHKALSSKLLHIFKKRIKAVSSISYSLLCALSLTYTHTHISINLSPSVFGWYSRKALTILLILEFQPLELWANEFDTHYKLFSLSILIWKHTMY
jgi:hypothetical protein